MDHEENPSVSRSEGLSLESLGPDILRLVAEQVYLTYASEPFSTTFRHPLNNLCLVSHGLNAAVLPFRYRKLAVKPKLFELPQNQDTQRFWDNVHKYTRNLIFLWPLHDIQPVAKMLSSCVHIESITWSKSMRNDKFGDLYIPPEMGGMIQDHWPEAKLHLADYSSIWSGHPRQRMPYLSWENVVSITTFRGWGHSKLEALQQLVAESPKLQSFELNRMTQTFLPSGPKLPPVQNLSLISCNWDYSTEDVESIWDFSQLKSLSTVSDTNWKFFQSLPRNALRNLTELKATSAHHDPTDSGLTSELNHFISSAPGLISIEITCSLERLNINNLVKNWAQLRALTIHDYTGFGPNARVCPTLSIADLTNMQKCCPKLRELSLDLDTRTCDKITFIEIIATFKNLTTLTLHTERTQTEFVDYNEITIGPGADRSEIPSFDDSDLPSLIDHVRRHKVGLPFESIVITTGGYGFPVSSLATEEWEA